MAYATPQLPTYREAAAVLERQTGAGAKLVGWTAARAALIALPMRAVGARWNHAILGSLLASVLISGIAVARIRRGRDG